MRTALYLRVSTEEQAREGVSLAAQESALVAFCKSQGWTVSGLYVDDGYSGKDLNRPGLQKLLADCAARKVDLVLVYKIDRLSRRQKDCLYLLEDVFLGSGVGFRSGTESFDTTTPFGKAMIGILAVFAQLERETIVERVRMGKAQAAKEGRWSGGPKPTYGYRVSEDGRTLMPDPATAHVVKLIFHLYTEKNMGYEAIARYLNGENPDSRIYPPARGAKKGWVYSAVRYILKNPTYAGMTRHKVNTKNETAYQGAHEPLVSLQQFEHAGRLASEKNVRKNTKRQYLLSGLLVCAECGGRMRAKRQWVNWPKEPKKYHVNYVCYNYLGNPHHLVTAECTAGYRHGPRLEETFLEWLRSRKMHDLDVATTIVEEEIKSQTGSDPTAVLLEMEAIDKRLADITRRRSRWDEAYESGKMSLDNIIPRQKRLDEEFADLSRRKAELSGQLEKQAEAAISVARVIERAEQFGEAVYDMSHDEQWQIIHEMFDEIIVDRDGNIVDVRYRLT